MLILSLLAVAQVPADLSPADRQAVVSAVQDHLYDGESARWRWPPLTTDAGGYCPWVNAKNTLGAYTGFRQIVVLGARLNDGRYEVSQVPLDLSPDAVARLCRRWGYDTDAPPRER